MNEFGIDWWAAKPGCCVAERVQEQGAGRKIGPSEADEDFVFLLLVVEESISKRGGSASSRNYTELSLRLIMSFFNMK